MPDVEFMGKTFGVDEDGFIDSYENWSQEWVQLVKKEEGIEELNDEHRRSSLFSESTMRKTGLPRWFVFFQK